MEFKQTDLDLYPMYSERSRRSTRHQDHRGLSLEIAGPVCLLRGDAQDKPD